MARTALRRLTAPLLALALAASGALVATSPIPAYAGTAIKVVQVPCPGWAGSAPGWYATPLGVVQAQPSFLTSESRIVVNDLGTPITATFTSQTSRTFTIAVSSGVSVSGLFGFLSANVSTTITSSTTTSIGVTAQATVPAHSQVIGDYGVNSYHVTFDAYKVLRRQNIGGCWVKESTMGFEVEQATAPTNIQGWRVRLG
jgi:hypothetical protein